MTNASLTTIFAGLKPRIRQVLDGREYFQFHNGQVRRQIGHGRSAVERQARKEARRQICGSVWTADRPWIAAMAGGILANKWRDKEHPFAGPHHPFAGAHLLTQ